MTGIEISMIMAAASAASTVVSTVSAMGTQSSQAKAEKEKSRYEEANAVRQSALDIQNETREQTLRAGRQYAQGAGQGAGTSGNILDIMADTAYQSELSILGSRENMMLSKTAGGAERSNISSAAKSAQMSSLLTGVADLGSQGMSYYKPSPTKSSVPIPARKPVR